ncbi:hypothetical protein GAY30_25750, partial [Azospirillum brasilense]|nr:hypothetical protein [Azospirillum brasilense]
MTRGRDGGRRPEGSAGTLERWAAILGGTALGFAGARRGSWTLAALGGGLFLAGAAGVPLSSPLRQAAPPALRRAPTPPQANLPIPGPPADLFRHRRPRPPLRRPGPPPRPVAIPTRPRTARTAPARGRAP